MTRAGEPARIPVLDGLRGIAILLVMARHAVDGMSLATPVDRLVYHLGRLGSNGVDVFFVLSGFLITGILLDSLDRPDYFRRFYLRRTVRIFPLYYLTLAIVFFVVPIFTDPRTVGTIYEAADEQVWHWTYLSNWRFAWKGYYGGLAHFWSLAVEEQFYLVWPAVVLLAGPRRLPAVCLGAIGFSAIARGVCTAQGVSSTAIYVMTATRLDGLAIGALLAVVARRPEGLARFRRVFLTVLVASAALLLGFLALEWGRGRTPLLMVAGALPVAAASGAVMALGLTGSPGSFLPRLFRSGPLRFFGKYSYALYVVHPFAYEAVAGRWSDAWLPKVLGSQLAGRTCYAALAAAASVVVALLSWNLWEKHWLRLKGSSAS